MYTMYYRLLSCLGFKETFRAILGPAVSIFANIRHPELWVHILIWMNSLLLTFIFCISCSNIFRIHGYSYPLSACWFIFSQNPLLFIFIEFSTSQPTWDVLKLILVISLDATGGGVFQENHNILLDTCFRWGLCMNSMQRGNWSLVRDCLYLAGEVQGIWSLNSLGLIDWNFPILINFPIIMLALTSKTFGCY